MASANDNNEIDNDDPLTCYPFMIDETPYCVWGLDLAQIDLAFLNTLNAAYFDHIASIHGPLLEGDEAQYAATALRIAYSHALETLFALLAASIQAPHCIVAWMTKYKQVELESFVRKLHGRKPIYSRMRIDPINWEVLATHVLQTTTGDEERDKRLREKFATLWARFANDFLDKATDNEYNSIKHGLRVNQHGFTLLMGFQAQPNEAPPHEQMHLMGHSDFGTSYYTAHKLHDGRNFYLQHNAHNWNPQKFVYGLHMLSMSIDNLVSTLKQAKGVSGSEVNYAIPQDEAFFDLVWQHEIRGMRTFSTGPGLDESWIVPATKDVVIASYGNQSNPQQDRSAS
ncbi:MAG: hypothetical protein QOH93_439 [Chloroflexia bacterium]|nr:hypothetical protein [Chloroflexia bacterium]